MSLARRIRANADEPEGLDTLQTLQGLAERIARLPLEEVLIEVLDIAIRWTGACAATLSYHSNEGTKVVVSPAPDPALEKIGRDLLAAAVEAGRPFWPEVELETAGSLYLDTAFLVPLLGRSGPLGALGLYGQDGLALRSLEECALSLLASSLAQALDNAALADDARLLQFQDLRHILLAVLERAAKALDSDGGVVLLRDLRDPRDSEPEKIRVVAHYKWPELQNQYLFIGQGFAGQIVATGAPDFRNDYQHWPGKAPFFDLPEHQPKLGSLIGAPVTVQGEILGVVVLTSTSDRRRLYDEEDLERLEQLAGPVTLAVENARRMSFERALIDHSPHAVIGANASGALTIFNSAAERLTGYEKQEMLGRKAHEIYWNGMLEVVKIHRKLSDEGGYTQIDSSVRARSGEEIPVFVSAGFLSDDQGSYLGSITVLEDLRIGSLRGKSAHLFSAIDQIDRSQDLQGLTDTIVEEAIRLFDADTGGLFLESGPLFRARSYQHRSGIRLPPWELRQRVLRKNRTPIRELLQGETSRLWHRRPTESDTPLLPDPSTVLLIRIAEDENVYGILSLESTQSDRFRFEPRFIQIFAARCAEALKRVELERGRRRVEEALIRLGGTIDAAQVSRMMVHEIKNSLITLFWTVREIKEADPGAGETELGHRIGTLEKEIARLRKLTDQLREIAGDSLPARKSKAYLNDIVSRTVDVLGSSMRRRRIRCDLALDPSLGRPRGGGAHRRVFVDQDQISQVIINLALNAMRASDEGSCILFETRAQEARAELRVTDTGSGLTQSQIRKLLQLGLSAKIPGSGLGLAICKRIVEENHGGRLEIWSRKGKGTTVSVLLPLYR